MILLNKYKAYIFLGLSLVTSIVLWTVFNYIFLSLLLLVTTLSYTIVAKIFKLLILKYNKVPGAGINLKLTFAFILISSIPIIFVLFLTTWTMQDFIESTFQESLSEKINNLKIDSTKNLNNAQFINYVHSKKYSHLIERISMKILTYESLLLYSKEIVDNIRGLKDSLDFLIIFHVSKNKIDMYPFYLNNNYLEYKTNIPKTRLINQLALVFFKLIYGIEKQNIKENYQTSDIFDSNKSDSPIKLSAHYHIRRLQSKKDYYVFTGLGINPLNLKIANEIKQINSIKMNKEDAIEPAKKYIKLIIYLISAPTLLIAILISFFMARSLLRPIETLISGTKEVAKGNLEFQIQEIGKGELGDLIQSFNFMTSELLRNKDELYRIEKVAAWRDVARNLAHEIKNPLTPIKLASERLIRQYQLNKKNFGDVLKNCSKIIISEVERLKVLVNEFSEFARLPKIELNEENIVKIITDIYTIYETSHPNASFRVENRLESLDEILLIDKEKIKQVFINLIDNSLDANNKNLEIIIYLNYINSDDKNYCQIEVSDNGIGIPQIDMIHIFEPYYTTKKRGTGLGLSIVKNIIEEHEGHVYVHSQHGFGTSFYIELPYNNG